MYQIRKCERVTVISQSEVASIDPEKFRSLSVPYEGDTEEEFVLYLDQNRFELEEIWEEIEEETMAELNKLWEPEMTEYSNSAWKGEDSWLEIGEENPDYSKCGGFESRHSTAEQYQ